MANTDAKWNEQSFLLDFIEQFLYLNEPDQRAKTISENFKGKEDKEDKKYKNFTQITTGDSSTTINELLLGEKNKGKKAARFFNFKNEQLSGLVPQIRIFKIIPSANGDVQQEFYFNDFTTVESIKSGTKQRGTDVGIVSFNWEDLGTQPADTGVSFKATLTLHFQSIDGLFMDRGPNRPKFSDLAVPSPSGRSRDLIREAKQEQLLNKEDYRAVYDTDNFRIKAIVGWATPRDPNGVIYKNQGGIKDIDAIKQQKVSLFLNLYDHTIDFREDGSLQLTLEYMAAIESAMKTSQYDLLYINDGDERLSAITANQYKLADLKRKLRSAKVAQEKLKEDPTPRTDSYGGIEGFTRFFKSKEEKKDLDKRNLAGGQYRLTREQLKKDIVKLDGKINKVEDQLQSLEEDLRGESYQRLLKKLSEKQLIYTFSLNKSQILTWQQSLLPDARKNKERFRLRKEILDEISGVSPNSTLAPTLNEFNNSLLEANSKKERKDAFKEYEETIAKASEESKTKLNFFFLGDLIEAATEILKEKNAGFSITNYVTPGPEFANALKTIPEKPQYFMAMAKMPFYFYDNEDNVKVTSIPISNIPISVKVFDAWFVKNVIKPLRESYTLHNFIRDVISELVSGAIAPLSYGKISQYQKTSLAISTIAYPKKGSNIPPGFQEFKSLKIPPYDNDHGEKTILNQLFLIYYNGGLGKGLQGLEKTVNLKKFGEQGKYIGDEEKGILHFKYGKDRGVIKSISLSKTDIPGAREMRIEKATTSAKSNLLFSNKYDCNISMFGMTTFKPGMLIYLDPNSLGVPRDNYIARNLGIGGYYRVVRVSNTSDAGKFETSITAIFEGPESGSDEDTASSVDYGSFVSRSKFIKT
jgi:hypothetical protein